LSNNYRDDFKNINTHSYTKLLKAETFRIFLNNNEDRSSKEGRLFIKHLKLGRQFCQGPVDITQMTESKGDAVKLRNQGLHRHD
jgi:hypothetical protein